MSLEQFDTYKLEDWELQSGEKIKNAHIAYKTFGDPKSPAIVYPTWFSGSTSRSNREIPLVLV
jgi:homoserine acetyltransferase